MIRKLLQRCLITENERMAYQLEIQFWETLGFQDFARRIRRGLRFRECWPIVSMALGIVQKVVLQKYSRR